MPDEQVVALPMPEELPAELRTTIEQLAEEGVTVDFERRRVEVRGIVLLDRMNAGYPIEYLLVTNGGFAKLDPGIEAFSVQHNHMGISIANAAKHKLVGLLAAKLAPDGVYVGELMVLGTIKGSAWDTGQGNLEASAVADKFWSMYQARTEIRAEIA